MRRIKKFFKENYDSSLDISTIIKNNRIDIFQGTNFFKAIWQVNLVNNELYAGLDIDSFIGWSYDEETSVFKLMSNGKVLDIVRNREGNINYIVKELYNSSNKNSDMSTISINDFENWIRSITDIYNINGEY